MSAEDHRTLSEGGAQSGALRGLYVLETLAALEQPASLPDIAAATGLPKFKAYRALRALEEDGFVDHVGRRGYRIGLRAAALSSLIGLRPTILRMVRPVINDLARETELRASLSLRSGTHRVLVLGAVARAATWHEATWIGQRSWLTSGCSGTVILAHLPEEEAMSIITSSPPGGQVPSSEQLAAIRQDGFALSFSDNHAGLNGIAVAVRDPEDGYPFGSIGLAGPAAQLSETVMRGFSCTMLPASERIGSQLAQLMGRHATQPLEALELTMLGAD